MLKETTDIAVAVGKLSASLIKSFEDGKFELLADGANFFDDIPAVFAAIDGAGMVGGEVRFLTQDERAAIKQTVIDTIIKDLGGTYEDQELLFAAADIAEGALAVVFLASRKGEEAE